MEQLYDYGERFLTHWHGFTAALSCWLIAVLLILRAGLNRVYAESWLGVEYHYPVTMVLNFCVIALGETILYYLILYRLTTLHKTVRLAIVTLLAGLVAYATLGTFDLPPIFYAHGHWSGLVALASLTILVAPWIKRVVGRTRP